MATDSPPFQIISIAELKCHIKQVLKTMICEINKKSIFKREGYEEGILLLRGQSTNTEIHGLWESLKAFTRTNHMRLKFCVYFIHHFLSETIDQLWPHVRSHFDFLFLLLSFCGMDSWAELSEREHYDDTACLFNLHAYSLWQKLCGQPYRNGFWEKNHSSGRLITTKQPREFRYI